MYLRRPTKRNQSGFSVIEVLFVVLVVAVLAVTSLVVYKLHKPSSTKNSVATSQTQTTTQPQSTSTTTKPAQSIDPYADWKTYTSSDGNITFRYPAGWYVSGGGTGPSAGEIDLEPHSSQTTFNNAFLMTLWVTNQQDYGAQPLSIPDGTVQQLSNGVNLWQVSEAGAKSTSAGICPIIQIINQDKTHFSYQLKNGEYLTGYGGYCEGQKDTVNLTYQQQLTSQPWQDAIKIIASINFQ